MVKVGLVYLFMWLSRVLRLHTEVKDHLGESEQLGSWDGVLQNEVTLECQLSTALVVDKVFLISKHIARPCDGP